MKVLMRRRTLLMLIINSLMLHFLTLAHTLPPMNGKLNSVTSPMRIIQLNNQNNLTGSNVSFSQLTDLLTILKQVLHHQLHTMSVDLPFKHANFQL